MSPPRPHTTEALASPARRRLLYRCRRRGRMEIELLLGAWADAHLASLSEDGCGALHEVLEQPDLFLWQYFTQGDASVFADSLSPAAVALLLEIRAYSRGAEG